VQLSLSFAIFWQHVKLVDLLHTATNITAQFAGVAGLSIRGTITRSIPPGDIAPTQTVGRPPRSSEMPQHPPKRIVPLTGQAYAGLNCFGWSIMTPLNSWLSIQCITYSWGLLRNIFKTSLVTNQSQRSNLTPLPLPSTFESLKMRQIPCPTRNL